MMSVKNRAQERLLIGSTAALALVIWFFQSLHWHSMMDGDTSIFPLMSTEVLKGHHFIYTAGQAHGGTPLVYLRALVFRIFGVSQFTAVFLNGLVLVASGVLWSCFAYRLAGPLTCLAVGLLTAIGSEPLAQYSLTDYYVLSFFAGGLMLNAAIALSARVRMSHTAAFWLGGLTGFAFYICRFTPLYALLATAFYLSLSPSTRSAALLPAARELYRTRGIKGIVSKLLLVGLAVNTLLIFPAFFTSDSFLGVNAEAALKTSAKLALALWLLHRWPLLLKTTRPLIFAAGATLGMVPHFAFALTHPEHIDRTTGLVRWSDFAPLVSSIPFNVGSNFARAAPLTWGLAGAIAALLLLALGFTGRNAKLKRWLAIGLVAGVLPAIASWVLIHTYMYFKVQYFYPGLMPLYLCLGLAVASSRWKPPALALLGIVLLTGCIDLYASFSKPNYRINSGILETMHEWGVDKGTGFYDSTYDVMWALGNQVTLDPLHASRFPLLHDQVTAAPRIAYIFHEGDDVPEAKSEYKIERTRHLPNGYTLELLSKSR
ncbi:MAG: hypothetical protein HY074_09205 [Deltaproteobacteria bacterium]|nr:hypothetical protein [Deltaproteobacteria bacterium]